MAQRIRGRRLPYHEYPADLMTHLRLMARPLAID